ncbi:hypothetical protein [Pontimicrobium sp. IMCC45349]|uniref:hypothetical protein n=1 Tax=Pontimicrobium sp. IMCC45349 TaxID=3391574 RepID=UPI0039A27D25
MKKLIFFFILQLFFACSKNDEKQFIDSEIVGKWQLVSMIDDMILEHEVEIGNQWEDVENGRVLELLSNGTFNNLLPGECIEGDYTIEDNIIDYSCDSVNENHEYFTLVFSIDENDILTISTGFVGERFERILE